jgi:hypothetical protein
MIPVIIKIEKFVRKNIEPLGSKTDTRDPCTTNFT